MHLSNVDRISPPFSNATSHPDSRMAREIGADVCNAARAHVSARRQALWSLLPAYGPLDSIAPILDATNRYFDAELILDAPAHAGACLSLARALAAIGRADNVQLDIFLRSVGQRGAR